MKQVGNAGHMLAYLFNFPMHCQDIWASYLLPFHNFKDTPNEACLYGHVN